jgi:hypothetical protein
MDFPLTVFGTLGAQMETKQTPGALFLDDTTKSQNEQWARLNNDPMLMVRPSMRYCASRHMLLALLGISAVTFHVCREMLEGCVSLRAHSCTLFKGALPDDRLNKWRWSA